MWVNEKAVDPDNCRDSVLTRVYIDENDGIALEYNTRQRQVVGRYVWGDDTNLLQVTRKGPAGGDVILHGKLTRITGGLRLDGVMGFSSVKMDWQKVW